MNSPSPSHQEIRLRAHELWQERGRPLGTPETDWFKAERELSRKLEGALSRVRGRNCDRNGGRPRDRAARPLIMGCSEIQSCPSSFLSRSRKTIPAGPLFVEGRTPLLHFLKAHAVFDWLAQHRGAKLCHGRRCVSDYFVVAELSDSESHGFVERVGIDFHGA